MLQAVAVGGSEVAAIADKSYLPVQYMMYFLEHIHTMSGLPWYVSSTRLVDVTLGLFAVERVEAGSP